MKRRARSTSPTKLRYSPEAAYARGGETRARLIAAAIRLFGERGYDGASTREIATAASLNTPALQYYFNNKEGLYSACAEQLIEHGWSVLREVVQAGERLAADEAPDAALMEGFCSIQDKLLDFLEGVDEDWLSWLAREQTGLGSTSGYLIQHPKSVRVRRACRALLARLMRVPLREPVSAMHELTLNGHVFHLHLMRARLPLSAGGKRHDALWLDGIKRATRLQSMASMRALAAIRKRAPKARARP